MGKPEGKKTLGKRRSRRVDIIEIDLTEIGWDCMDWFDLDQIRPQWRTLVITVMNLQVP